MAKKKYREGAIGALMDEYERAVRELQALLQTIDTKTYVKIIDSKTKDPDCRSVQTIMNHVVRAGFGYASLIRQQFKEIYRARQLHYPVNTPQLAIDELNHVLTYTEETLSNKWNFTWRKIRANVIHTSWGQDFDIDQLMEHAIVHILRHRRQIEKMLNK
ncbi:MAG TPA: DinB family protein [Chitinophagales bacterium]|nr:DinB family protein [Chitinophagales bacterium]